MASKEKKKKKRGNERDKILLFVFVLFVALKKIPSKICILSSLFRLKNVLFNLLCVFDPYRER